MSGKPSIRRVHKPTSPGEWIIGSVILVVVGGLILSCVLAIAIWPGEIKLLAPLFCTDAQPDAFVVADTYNPRPGETVTDFSLYCMGPRGDATEHGFFWPFVLISLLNGIALVGLMSVLGAIGRARRRRRAVPFGAPDDLDRFDEIDEPSGPTPGSTAGPFVE